MEDDLGPLGRATADGEVGEVPLDPLEPAGQVFEVVVTQKPTSGGSSDTEKKDPAANPTGRSS